MAQMMLQITLAMTGMSVSTLLTFAYKVADAIAANPGKFTNPNPTTAAVRKAADDLKQGEKDYKARKITRDERDAFRVKLRALLQHEADYVIALAEKLPPEDGAALIEAAGFTRRQPQSRGKEPFSLTHGETSGSIEARALRKAATPKKARAAVFHWEVSLDGQTWTEAARTFQSSATLAGLDVGKRYSVRFRVFHANTFGDYSQTLTIVVL
jgi:hypothetical protein